MPDRWVQAVVQPGHNRQAATREVQRVALQTVPIQAVATGVIHPQLTNPALLPEATLHLHHPVLAAVQEVSAAVKVVVPVAQAEEGVPDNKI